jgi:quinol monooxygenase YgiN
MPLREARTRFFALQTEGRSWMVAAEGCESFDILRGEADSQSLVFVQKWTDRAAHDTAFAQLIVVSGHLEKVLKTLDEPIVQNVYLVAS